MKVYLAGKIDDKAGSWRNAILGEMPWNPNKGTTGLVLDERWKLGFRTEDMDELWYDDPPILEWPEQPKAVLGLHTYVGPYRQESTDEPYWKSMGIGHGLLTAGQHGQISGDAWPKIVSRCAEAIDRADLVFVYLNRADPYGTLVELGYAKARGKFVAVFVDPDCQFAYEDFAFAEAMADHWGSWNVWTCTPRYPCESASHDPDCRRAQNEGVAVASALKDAIVAYAAWTPPRAELHDIKDRIDQRMVTESFEQIARWSADPRVRTEAQRMIRRLA